MPDHKVSVEDKNGQDKVPETRGGLPTNAEAKMHLNQRELDKCPREVQGIIDALRREIRFLKRAIKEKLWLSRNSGI